MNRMKAETPPMGWNTWNTFGFDISEQLIVETADKMITEGLLDAGYHYLVIDDCWSLKERDQDGRLVADPGKFPHGMKWLSDYVHSKGLKFGMYSCAGTLTCAGYPSSFEHEFIDAQTFAEWGVDYLKYDCCNKPINIPAHILYKRMALALKNCGRDIVFAACNAGLENAETWARSSGPDMWRCYYDIIDNWQSITTIVNAQLNKENLNGPCCFSDMDMLVVGMYGKGNVGLGGCSDVEYKSHFSLWCLMTSPLMIGCDIRNMSEQTKFILLNKDLIAINQDAECRQAYTITSPDDENLRTYVKVLSNGDLAVALFNFTDTQRSFTLSFYDLGLPFDSPYALEFYDVWTHKVDGVYKQYYRATIDSHDCRVFRARMVRNG